MRYEIRQYSGGELMCNGYLVAGENGEFVAVDAPTGFAEHMLSALGPDEKIRHLILTHQHFDHIADAARLQKETACLIHAGEPYSEQLTLAQQAALWGIEPPTAFKVQPLPKEDTEVQLAGLCWRILHVPGHARDGLCLYVPALSALFTGDALFSGSIGRTDFPGGNAQQLVHNLREKVLCLPQDTVFYPGHGPSGTLGTESLRNPYFT